MLQSHSEKAQLYRRRANACDTLAACAQSFADQDQLLRMRDTNLTLAAKEDWLDGLPPVPPANVKALVR